MGLWPFGGRKKGRTSQAPEQGRQTDLEKSRTDLDVGRSTSSSQDFTNMPGAVRDEKPRRLSKQRMPSQPSYVPRSQTTPINVPAAGLRGDRQASATTGTATSGTDLYAHNPTSKTSIGPDSFTALPQAPTLLAKRSGFDPTLHRRKSSKRKAEDYAREREVRAMSSPIQSLRRPMTYSGSGPLRRDTKQIPGDLNRRLHRPTSEVSLPIPETIQDSDDPSSQASFKIGFLAALSPRPSLTYVADSRPSHGKQPAKLKPTIHQAIEEEDPTSRKRINELADELDAGGLRELMERDRKRRDKKKEADHARLERRLQRKADRQREEELRGRRLNPTADNKMATGAEQSDKTPRGILEDRTKRPRDGSADEPPFTKIKDSDPFVDPDHSPTSPVCPIRNPFEDEKELENLQDPFEQAEEEPPIPMKSPLRTTSVSRLKTPPRPIQVATISPPTSPVQRATDQQSMSQTSRLGREITPETQESELLEQQRPSDQSSQPVGSWTSFFRRGGRRKPSITDRGRSTPSEFSNTSRESFAARLQQAPPVVIPRSFRKSDSSSVPQRTLSKFREDLPELPLSPPDSRVQSPEVMTGPQIGQAQNQTRHSLSGTLDNRSLVTASSSAALDRAISDAHPPPGPDADATGTPSAAVLSQSLASVDSEGSWLSGKPPKRLSGPMSHPLRQSQSSIPPQAVPGAFEHEDDDLANDEYLNRLTPGPDARRDSVTSAGRRASSNVIDLERERQQSPVPDVPQIPAAQDRDETWHKGVARQPTVVRQATRARSREGLLNEASNDTPGASRSPSIDGDDEELDLPGETPGSEVQEVTLMRAQSVDYKNKGHARHMSAGSARILDIRRSSMQSESTPRSPSFPQNLLSSQREQCTFAIE